MNPSLGQRQRSTVIELRKKSGTSTRQDQKMATVISEDPITQEPALVDYGYLFFLKNSNLHFTFFKTLLPDCLKSNLHYQKAAIFLRHPV